MQTKKFDELIENMEVLQQDETGKLRGGFAVVVRREIKAPF